MTFHHLLWPQIRSEQATLQAQMSSIDQGTAGHLAQNIILESKIEELKLHTPSGPSHSQDLLTQEDRIHKKKENKENNGHLMAANELECHALIWGCNLSWLPTLTLSRDLRDLRAKSSGGGMMRTTFHPMRRSHMLCHYIAELLSRSLTWSSTSRDSRKRLTFKTRQTTKHFNEVMPCAEIQRYTLVRRNSSMQLSANL